MAARAGHDAIHTLDLPQGNRTADAELIEIADREDRIVVTKDADFVQSYLVSGTPARLWLISAGNLRNAELMALISSSFAALSDALQTAKFIELSAGTLVVHE